MELVTGVEWSDRSGWARARGFKGAECNIPFKELVNTGLPRGGALSRRITTDLRSWRAIEFDEYAYAFQRCLSSPGEHSAWSFRDGATRWVVPALALIRAFVRPGPILFPHLFKPQSLDDVCAFNDAGSGAFIAPRVRFGDIRPTPTLTGLLSWFYCFPSARRTWASVYQSAKAGRLHFELPSAVASFTIRSVRVGYNAYVTSLNLSAIDAQEAPAEFATEHPRIIVPSGTSMGGYARAARLVSRAEALPTYVEVSDHEWAAVAPLLANKKGIAATQNRDLLNALLQKQTSQATWAELESKYGVRATSASTTRNRWRADGRLERVERALGELRGQSS